MPGFWFAKAERWVWRNWLGETVSRCVGALLVLIGVLHAATTAMPVAVVEIQALALQDEGADAVLEEG